MDRFSPAAPKAPRAPGSRPVVQHVLAFVRSLRETRMLVLVAIGALSTFAFYAVVIYPVLVYGGAAVPSAKSPARALASAEVADASAPIVASGPEDASAALADAGSETAPAPFRVADLKTDPSVKVVEGVMGKRALFTAMAAAGVSRADTQRLIKAFDGLRNLDKTRPKDTFVVAKEKSGGKLVGFEYITSITDVWQARANDSGELVGKKLDLPLDERRVALGLVVGNDLRESLVKAGLDDDMMGLLDDALDGRVELAAIRSGARLRLLATEQRVAGEFVRYAELDALEYVPADAHASAVRVYRLPREGSHAFYDAKGQQPTSGGWRKPVPLARIASRFNPHRMHPVLHVRMPHNGVDFAAPPGTPVYAAAAGTVKFAANSGPCGNMVQILHPSGLISAYCHLSRFAAGLHPGQHVEVRQLIGYVGATGRVTGPHLHFAIKRNGKFIDPLSLQLDGIRVVPPSAREAFDAARTKLDAELDQVALPPSPSDGRLVDDAGAHDTEETVFDEVPGQGEPAH